MTSKEVKELLSSEKGIKELYKKTERYFLKIDEWSEKFTNSDLLNEYEIALAMDQISGCYGRLQPIAGAIEAIMEENEHNVEVKEYAELDKVRTQDTAVVKAKARNSIADLRKYTSDFVNYCKAAQCLIITAQSRIKRLTVEKSAKKIDYTGEIPPEETAEIDTHQEIDEDTIHTGLENAETVTSSEEDDLQWEE